MLQFGNVRPTEVVARTDKAVSTDVLEPFLIQRYRAAYAAEMAHFFDVLRTVKPLSRLFGCA